MRVAVVGLGRMGKPIAARLLDAGHELTVFNRTPERAQDLVGRGATLAGSLPEVWASADACITMIADDAALLAVATGAEGLLSAAPPGSTLVDMSTVSVGSSAKVAAAAAEAGVAYLRAPVSGNPSVVEAGSLTIMVSGDETPFRALEPTLRDIGPKIFYVGGADEARVLKLALNLMIAGTCELMAEAIALGEASGLDRADLLAVMGESAAGSPFVKYKTAGLVARDYTATFTVELMQKDVDLVLGVGRDAGVSLPVGAELRRVLAETIAKGYGELDLTALLLNLEASAPADAQPPKS